MNQKKTHEARVPAESTKRREQTGTKVLDTGDYLFFRPQVRTTCTPVIDADSIQAEANEVRPEPQEEVIVA